MLDGYCYIGRDSMQDMVRLTVKVADNRYITPYCYTGHRYNNTV